MIMEKRISLHQCLFLLLLLPIMARSDDIDDFSVFCELVNMNSLSSWCSTCSSTSPSSSICGSCGVACNDDEDRITGINIQNKGITVLPESIGSLTALTAL